jgi:hypothetical protein
MQMMPSDDGEGWVYAHGIAAALNWADARCEACGAGRWTVLTRDWVLCDVCELAVPVAEIARDAGADPDRRAPVAVVRLPALSQLWPADSGPHRDTARAGGA